MGLATVVSDSRNRAFYTGFEAVAGAVVSLRLGANPGELVDFLLGFAGVDVMGDDVGEAVGRGGRGRAAAGGSPAKWVKPCD